MKIKKATINNLIVAFLYEIKRVVVFVVLIGGNVE